MNTNVKALLQIFTIILVLFVISSCGVFILFPTYGIIALSASITIIPLLTILAMLIVLFQKAK